MQLHSKKPETPRLRRAFLSALALAILSLPSFGQVGNQPARPFDIPAGPAEVSLKEFSRESGRGVIAGSKTVDGIQTSAVQGSLAPKEALDRMLMGTGLVASEDAETGAFAVRHADAGPSRLAALPVDPDRPKAASNSAPSAEEIVSLSDFNVSTSPTNEYLAADSITGTRVASKLGELPFSVTAVTSEFIDDFVLLELNDQLATVSGYSPNETENNYQLRGFSSGTTLVDGFRWIGSAAAAFAFDIDRIEVLKGPAASIYGQINPGGIINTITRKPLNRPEQGIDVLAGSMDTLRAEGYTTGPVNAAGTISYRADVAYEQRRYVPQFADMTRRYGNLQFAYRPDKDTDLNVSFSAIDTYKHALVGLPIGSETLADPFRTGQTFTHYTNLNFNLWDFSLQGPDAFQHARTEDVRATLEHRFNSVWSVRAAVNAVKATTEVNRQGGNTLVTASQTLKLDPLWELTKNDALAGQIDTLAAFRTGWISHKLLFTLDFDHEHPTDVETEMSSASEAIWDPNFTLSTVNPLYGFEMYRDNPAAYDKLVTDTDLSYSVYGGFLSDRAYLFNGRLILLIGGRYDSVHTDPQSAGSGAGGYSVADFTHQFGATFLITKEISLYANQCSSFSPQPQVDLNGNPLPNEKGSGYEYGVKWAMANGRLNLSLDRFQVDRENVLTVLTDPVTGAPDYDLSEHQRSDGYEADLNWQVSDALQVIGGYGHTTARTVDAPSALYLVGQDILKRVPVDNLGIALRYRFNGALKGLSATTRVVWLTKSIINIGGRSVAPTSTKPIANIPFANGLLPYPNLPANSLVKSGAAVELPDGRESIFNPPATTWDFGLSYRFKVSKHWGNQLRLSVKNAFDLRYSYGAGVAADPRMILGEYTLTF